MNSRGPPKTVYIIRNFTLAVASFITVIMPEDLVVCTEVFAFNSPTVNLPHPTKKVSQENLQWNLKGQ